MSIENQISALKSRVDAAQAQSKMELDRSKFSLQATESHSNMGIAWKKLEMEWNLHVQEVIKKQIENEIQTVKLRFLIYSFKQFQANYRRLKGERLRHKAKMKRRDRFIKHAKKVFFGVYDRSGWKFFGRLAVTSSVVFPATNYGECFGLVNTVTPRMTIPQLSLFCIKNEVTVDPASTEFQAIFDVWDEIEKDSVEYLDEIRAEIIEVETSMEKMKLGKFTEMF